MRRSVFSCAMVACATIALLTVSLAAEVKTRDKTQFKLEGMAGRIVGMFAGKGAREGIVGTTAVNGDRKLKMTDNNGQLIDLREEKIYDVDYRKKEYKVTTFEEMRRRIREEQERARKQASEEAREERREHQPSEPQKEYEVDFDVKETGQRKQLAGYDAREVVMTVTVREKGRALDESGGVVMTAQNWFGPEIPALKELLEFDMRYFKQLYGEETFGLPMDQMAVVMAMYPMLSKASERLQKEGTKLSGAVLATTTTFEAVKSKAQLAEEAKSSPGGGGGLSGMLARRIAKKEEPKQRALVFTVNHEIQEVATTVPASELEIPAGFKEKR